MPTLIPQYHYLRNTLIEVGDHEKTYDLDVSDRYIKFLLDKGAQVSKETHDLVVQSLGDRYDERWDSGYREVNPETGREERFQLVKAIKKAYKAQSKGTPETLDPSATDVAQSQGPDVKKRAVGDDD